MISFKEFVSEGKQVGVIYHYTSIEGAISILRDNTIRIGRYGYVSFTRDKNFHTQKSVPGILRRNEVATLVSFIVDGNALSNTYKVTPYTDYEWQYINPVRARIYNEQEEIVDKDIKHIKKFIIGIRLHFKVNKNTKDSISKLEDVAGDIQILKSK